MRASILAVLTILWKDVVLELRTKDIVVTALVFALLVIVVFNFAITPTPQTVAFVAPGILWIAFTFGGVLGLNRSMALENESGGLHALMLTPVSRDLIFFALGADGPRDGGFRLTLQARQILAQLCSPALEQLGQLLRHLLLMLEIANAVAQAPTFRVGAVQTYPGFP